MSELMGAGKMRGYEGVWGFIVRHDPKSVRIPFASPSAGPSAGPSATRTHFSGSRQKKEVLFPLVYQKLCPRL